MILPLQLDIRRPPELTPRDQGIVDLHSHCIGMEQYPRRPSRRIDRLSKNYVSTEHTLGNEGHTSQVASLLLSPVATGTPPVTNEVKYCLMAVKSGKDGFEKLKNAVRSDPCTVNP